MRGGGGGEGGVVYNQPIAAVDCEHPPSFPNVRRGYMDANKKECWSSKKSGHGNFFSLHRLILFSFLSLTNQQSFNFSNRKEKFRDKTRLRVVYDCLSAFQLVQDKETQQPSMWRSVSGEHVAVVSN